MPSSSINVHHHHRQSPTKTRLELCGHYFKATLAFLFSHIGLTALVVGYSLLGASMFSMLEQPNAIKARQEGDLRKQELVNNIIKMTKNLTIIRWDDWKDEAKNLVDHYTTYLTEIVKKKGYDGNNISDVSKWDFVQSLLFSVVVITTIGYGDSVPKTEEGKLATILYAIIGIPLMYFFLSTIGELMAHAFKFFYWKICCTVCFRPRIKKSSKKKRKLRKEKRRLKNQRRQERTKMAAIAAIAAAQQHIYQNKDTPGIIDDNHESPMSNGIFFSAEPFSTPPSSSNVLKSRFTEFVEPYKASVIPNKFALQNESILPMSSKSQCQLSQMANSNAQNIKFESEIRKSTSVNGSMMNKNSALLENDHQPITCQPSMLPYPPFNYNPNLDNLLNPQTLLAQINSNDSDSESDSDEVEYTNVPIPVCIALLVGYILTGAFLFLEIQDSWSFEESAYFCFITLTTIGFGDYLPKTEHIANLDSKISLIMCAFYTIFGMALIAMCFNLVQAEVTRIIKSFAAFIGLISKNKN